jgi:hypothetical protein
VCRDASVSPQRVCVCVCLFLCVCFFRLGIVAPSVVAFCASIKLCGSLISRSCLKHPPKRSSILALWAVDTGGRKCLNAAIIIHDLKRYILSCLDVYFFPTLFLNSFSFKAAFWADHGLFFFRCRPQACLAFWTKTQST